MKTPKQILFIFTLCVIPTYVSSVTYPPRITTNLIRYVWCGDNSDLKYLCGGGISFTWNCPAGTMHYIQQSYKDGQFIDNYACQDGWNPSNFVFEYYRFRMIVGTIAITNDNFRPFESARKYLGHQSDVFTSYFTEPIGAWIYSPEQKIRPDTGETYSFDNGCLSSYYVTLYSTSDTYTEVESKITYSPFIVSSFFDYHLSAILVSMPTGKGIPKEMRLTYTGTCKSAVCNGERVEIQKHGCGKSGELLCSSLLETPLLMTYLLYDGIFYESSEYGLIEVYCDTINIYYKNTVESGPKEENTFFYICISSGQLRFSSFNVNYENSNIPHWYDVVSSQLCTYGYYASTDVSEPCKLCPVGKFSNLISFVPNHPDLYEDASFICMPCDDFTTTDGINPASIRSHCICPPNYTEYDYTQYPNAINFNTGEFFDGRCSPGSCPISTPGKYCIPYACPAGYFHHMDYITVSNYHYYRVDGTYTVVPTTILFQLSNSIRPAQNCSICPIGFYRNSTTSKERCVQCPEGTFTLHEGSPSIEYCVCSVGYFGNRYDTCSKCPMDTYKDTYGFSSECQRCPDDLVTFSYGSNSVYDCKCNIGKYEISPLTCRECPDYAYNDQVNQTTCIQCAPGFAPSSKTTGPCNRLTYSILPPGPIVFNYTISCRSELQYRFNDVCSTYWDGPERIIFTWTCPAGTFHFKTMEYDMNTNSYVYPVEKCVSGYNTVDYAIDTSRNYDFDRIQALPINDNFRPITIVYHYVGHMNEYVTKRKWILFQREGHVNDAWWSFSAENKLAEERYINPGPVVYFENGCFESFYLTLYSSDETYTEEEKFLVFYIPPYIIFKQLSSVYITTTKNTGVPKQLRVTYKGTCRSAVCNGLEVEIERYRCGHEGEMLCSEMLKGNILMTYLGYEGVFLNSPQYGLIEVLYNHVYIYYTNTVESGPTEYGTIFYACPTPAAFYWMEYTSIFQNSSMVRGWYDIMTSMACSHGHYATTDVNEPCKQCPTGKYSNLISIVPKDPSLMQDAIFICEPCPAYTSTIGPAAVQSQCVCAPNASAYDHTEYPNAADFKTDSNYRLLGFWCIPDFCPPGYFHNMNYQTVYNYAGRSVTILFEMSNDLYPARDCRPCPRAFYRDSSMSGESCERCPLGLGTISTASTSINDCVCDLGFYYEVEQEACVPCAIGFYKDAAGGSSQCSRCPTGTTTLLAARTRVQDCVCDLGYFGERYDECQACPVGRYKNTIGFSAGCQLCPGDSTTEFNATTALNLCKCGPGFRGADGTECESCPDDTFKITFGDFPCIECKDTYVTVNDGSGNQACFCNLGNYEDDAGICVNCPLNTYKDIISNDRECTPCTNHSVTLQEGSTSVSNCLCKPRYGLNNLDLCVECGADTYKDVFSRGSCVGCPLFSTSNGFSIRTDCVCIAGYTGPNGGPCLPCTGNTYKPLPGDQSCTSCHPNMTSAIGSTSINSCQCNPSFHGPLGGPCQACDPNAYKPETGIQPCRCNPGYTGPDNGVCTPCDFGYYKTEHGSAACQECPSGTTTLQTGSIGIISCTCLPGYYNPSGTDGVECQPCPIGSYSTVYSSTECVSCTGNTSTFFTGSTDSDDCVCDPGHEFISSSIIDGVVVKECSPCGQHFFKTTRGDDPCFLCPENSWTDQVVPPIQCKCRPNYAYEGLDPSDCSTCSEDAYWDGSECLACPLYSSGPFGRSTFEECLCSPGYSYPTGTECLPCPFNTYKDTISNDDCTNCPFTTMSDIGSDSVSKCACPFGYFKNGDDCDPCPANTYKPTFGNTSCLSCKENSVSQPGSKIEGFCLCDRGFFLDSQDNCIQCQGSTYKETISNGACTPCKQNEFFSGNDHTTSASCVCDIGYYQLFDGTCVECNVGEVKYFLGPGPCINPLQGIGCSSLCTIGQRLQTNNDVYPIFIQESGICGQSVPITYTFYNTTTSAYMTINATTEMYLDQIGDDEANWRYRTRVIIPNDYIPPECYWYVSNVQPSIFELQLQLLATIDQTVVYRVIVYRCSACSYTASGCSTIRSFNLLDNTIQTIQINIDVYSCIVIRLFSETFPLILYNLGSLPLSNPPEAFIQIQSSPPTCECVDCEPSDTPIPILKPSFVKIWASASTPSSLLQLDSTLKNTSMDMPNALVNCIIVSQLHTRVTDMKIPCPNLQFHSFATLVRFSSFSFVAQRRIFSCKSNDIHEIIMIKFDGKDVYNSTYTLHTDHYVEVSVGFGEHILECYKSSSAQSSLQSTESLRLEYLNWRYHYQPFTMELNFDTEGGYHCLQETHGCGDCFIGRRPKSPPSDCPCEPCPAGTYGIYQVGPNPYQCVTCSIDSYSASPGSISCIQCPNNSITGFTGAVSLGDCKCIVGYYLDMDQSTCRQCPPSTYKDFIGNDECIRCPDTRMSTLPGSTSVDACYCLGGFIKDASAVCTSCPSNTYQSSLTSCEQCPENRVSSVATNSMQGCVCKDGYTGDDCMDCDVGYRLLGGDCVLNKDFVSMVSASYHTCVIFFSKEAKCWGLNDMGQLGYLDTTNRGGVINTMGSNLNTLSVIDPFLKIITMRGWSCGQFINYEIKCWGNTRNDINDIQYFFDAPSEINFGTDVFATDLCGGEDHVCGVFNDGVVRCWGNNDHGQLGIGSRTSYYLLPFHITPSHPNISFPSPPRSIACGSYHSCALLENRKIYCWGRNQHQQLGFSSFNNEDILKYTQFAIINLIFPEKIYARGSRTCIIDIYGVPQCWGYCGDGSCGPNATVHLQTGRTALKLALSINTTCFLLDNHRVSCIGSNQYGQLGLDNSNPNFVLGLLVTDMGDALVYNNIPQTYVEDLFSGYYHFCYIDDISVLRCWGNNQHGQLGYENTVNLGDLTNGQTMSSGIQAVNVGSILIESCEIGFYYDLEDLKCVECNACPSGTFVTKPCSTYHNTKCQPCPFNTTSGFNALSYAHCSCKKGYERTIEDEKDAACKPCGLSHYKLVNTDVNCVECPIGTGSVRYGLDSVTQCECPAGFYGANGGDCTPCPENTFKNDFGSSECTNCPTLSKNSITGSKSITDCKCQEGYYDIGAINNILINCRLCPNGKYSNTIGSTSCTNCGFGLTSPTGSRLLSDCTCADNFFFYNLTGRCELCPANFFRNQGETECRYGGSGNVQCTPNSTLINPFSQSATDCVCNSGFYGNYLGCAKCPSFSINVRDQLNNSILGDCKCLPGYTAFSIDECRPCQSNTYKDFIGNQACTPCRDNFASNPGSTSVSQCQCIPGYEMITVEDVSNCYPCAINYYKNITSNEACLKCPNNSYTVSMASNSYEFCICTNGFYGTAPCTKCDFGFYSNINDIQYECTPCPSNSFTLNRSSTNISQCVCNPGHYSSNGIGPCTSCPLHHYQPNHGSTSCISCGVKARTLLASSTSVHDCRCIEGHEGDGLDCKPCPPNTFKSVTSNTACVPCPANSVTNQTNLDLLSTTLLNCICVPGYVSGGFIAYCEVTSEGFYKPLIGDSLVPCPLNTISSTASVSVYDCQCKEGFFGRDGNVCLMCPKNHYKSVRGNRPCTPCPENMISDMGSTSLDQCICPSGYGILYNPQTMLFDCKPCWPFGHNTYDSSNSACSNCPQNTRTMENKANTSEDCACAPGYFGSTTSDCSPCLPGTFKDYTGFGSCASCPPGLSTNDYGSIKCRCDNNRFEFEGVCYNLFPDFFDTFPRACAGNLVPFAGSTFGCVCMAGTIDFNGFLDCVPCGRHKTSDINSDECYCVENYYMDSNGDCQLCPDQKASPPRSTSVADCSCPQCVENGQCVPCAYPCPSNSYSIVKPYSIDDCFCDPGYYKDELSCLPCGVNETTIMENAQSSTECVCEVGNFRDNGICKPCAVNTFKSLKGDQPCQSCFPSTITTTTGQTTCQCTDLTIGPSELFNLDSKQELIIDTHDCYLVIDQIISIPGIIESGNCNFYINQIHSRGTVITRGYHPFAIYSKEIINITQDIRHLASTSETRGNGYYGGFCYYGGSGGGFGGSGGFGSAPGGSKYGAKELWPWDAFQGSPGGKGGDCNVYPTETNLGGRGGGGVLLASENGQIHVSTIDVSGENAEHFGLPRPGGGGSGGAILLISPILVKAKHLISRGGSGSSSTFSGGGGGGGRIAIWSPLIVYDSISVHRGDGFNQFAAEDGTIYEILRVPNDYQSDTFRCFQCKNGSYYEDQKCKYCGDNQIFNPSSNQCECKKGYTNFNTHGACTPCPTGTYKSFTGVGNCTLCPFEGSVSPLASEDVSQCKCNLGNYLSLEQASCTPCPKGTYQDRTNTATSCVSCPESLSTENEQSTAISSCTCPPGTFYDQFNVHCRNCSLGTYYPFYGYQLSCISCPFPTITPHTGSRDKSDCKCTPGYYFDASIQDCKMCEAGKYDPNSLNDFQPCSPCPIATYNSKEGSVGIASCIPCPRGTFSLSTEAKSIQTCQTCPLHTYQNSIQSTHCISCPSESITLSNRSISVSQCQCIAGYSGNLECLPCPMGYYKTQLGDFACESCPLHTYSDKVALASLDGCEHCPDLMFTESRAATLVTNCTCNPGTYFVSYEEGCMYCEAGYYQPLKGNHQCVACPHGKYNPQVGSIYSYECLDCPLNSNSSIASVDISDCKCDPGYYRDEDLDQCLPCPLGTYGVDNQACVECEVNFYQDELAQVGISSCKPCPLNSQTLIDRKPFISEDMCLCNKGYSYNNGVCSACIAGTYKSTINNIDGCSKCPVDTYGTITASDALHNCVSCIPNSTTITEGNKDPYDCKCNQGYYRYSMTQCKPCSPGSYKDTISNHLCTLCPTDTFSARAAAVSSLTCTQCPIYSNSNQGSTLCECNSGYIRGDQQFCEPCPPGTFDSLTSESCNECPFGTFSPSIAQDSEDTCQQCPMHSNTISTGSFDIMQCVCNHGFYRQNNQTCTSCQPGQYKPTTSSQSQPCEKCSINTYGPDASRTLPCISCPANSTTLDLIERTSLFDCVCNAGYYGNSHELPNLCLPCPPNYYCPGGQQKLPCYPNSTSPALSVNLTQCKCVPGFVFNKTCSLCPAQFYCPGLGNIVPCPFDSDSAPGSTSEDDCFCKTGFLSGVKFCNPGYTGAGTGLDPCRPCPKGTYKSRFGNFPCVDCPSGTTVSEASTSSDDCQ